MSAAMSAADPPAAYEGYEVVRVVRQGSAAVVTLDRKECLNAINQRMVRDLQRAATSLAGAEDVAAVVFTGEGRAFCAGADISEIAALKSAQEFEGFLAAIQHAYDLIETLPKPTIAAINGSALGGGCELALACDLRIMASGASIGVPEVKIGVLPGAGGTQRLPRAVPPAVAMRMLMFGDPITSEEAHRYGLVNEVVEREEVLPVALQWAARLAEMPPLALRAAKELVRTSRDGDLATGLRAERQAVALLASTSDRSEGMAAFLEKRPPTFSGR